MKLAKKIGLFLCLGLIVGVTGCSANKSAHTTANISNSEEKIAVGESSLTIGEIYNYVRKNNDSQISELIINEIMKKSLFSGEDTERYKNLYKKYLNDYFTTTFVENSTYQYDEKFDEDILVNYLKSESYAISCDGNPTEGLNATYFSCDYSDYISKEVNYDIYSKMLKIKYILDEKTSLFDKSKARKVYYYTESRDSSYTMRETFKEYLKTIKDNYDTTGKDVIDSLKEIGDSLKAKDLEKITTEYNKISTYDDNSSFTNLQKYTTCGTKRCSIVEGKKYQEDLILEKEYVKEEIVIKTNTSILFENARNLLFSDGINDNLYEIGTRKFLISPSFDGYSDADINDVVIYDGSGNYYLVVVETINSNSSNFEDKVAVAELLIDTISDSTVIDHYISTNNLEIYDKQIREYFISKYGDYKK